MSSVLGRALLASVGLVVALAAVASPQRPTASARSASRESLSGEWSGPIALDEGTKTLAFVFRVSDTTLAGTVYLDAGRFGEMQRPELSGDTVHFKIDQLDVTGVIEGTRMKVAIIVYNGSTRNVVLTKVPGSDEYRKS